MKEMMGREGTKGKFGKRRKRDWNKGTSDPHNNNLYTSKWNFIACSLSARQPCGTQQCVLITILTHAYWNHTKLKFFHFNLLPEKEMSSDKGFSPTWGKRALFHYFSPLSELLVTFVNASVCFTFLPFYNRQTADQIGAAGGGKQIKLWLAQSDSHTHTHTQINIYRHRHTLSGRCQMQQQPLLMGITSRPKFNVMISKKLCFSVFVHLNSVLETFYFTIIYFSHVLNSCPRQTKDIFIPF